MLENRDMSIQLALLSNQVSHSTVGNEVRDFQNRKAPLKSKASDSQKGQLDAMKQIAMKIDEFDTEAQLCLATLAPNEYQ